MPHRNRITDPEIAQLIREIDAGRVTLTAFAEPATCEVVDYVTSHGYALGVFNDCGEWDYLDYVVTPDGRALDVDALLALTSPPYRTEYLAPAVQWRAWGLPGHNRTAPRAWRGTFRGALSRPARAATKRGATKRGATKRGATKRGATKRPASRRATGGR